MSGRIKRIHVDQHVIRRNRARDRGALEGDREPPLTVQTSRGPRKGFEVFCHGVVKFIYRPERPLSCGARLWAETRDLVIVDGEEL